MKTFKLHLIRHGITQGNLDGVYVGGGMDVPLAEQGVLELEAMAQRFEYPRGGCVFTSPMRRAIESAAILYPDVQARYVIEELRENVFGEFEGRRVDELIGDNNFKKWLDPNSEFVPEGGESGRDFNQRCANALMTMMHHLATNDITEAACVTHGGVIMSMLSQLALPRRPAMQWMCDNGAGYTVAASAAMLMRDGIVEATSIVPYGYMPKNGGEEA